MEQQQDNSIKPHGYVSITGDHGRRVIRFDDAGDVQITIAIKGHVITRSARNWHLIEDQLHERASNDND